MTNNFVIPADTLARACANAGLFISGTQERWAGAHFMFASGELIVTACDSVVAGQNRLTAQTEGIDSFTLDKDGLSELDHAARLDKKNAFKVEVSPESIRATSSEGTEAVIPCGVPDHQHWDQMGELLDRVEMRNRTLPPRVLLDAKRLSRFARVKPDKGDRMMDMSFSDNYEPVQIKIGSDFIGLIMPVHREIHAAAIGGDGLWTE